jgi:hypothetical protein
MSFHTYLICHIQLNPNWEASLSFGRNAAPGKADDSVISTVSNLKIREDGNPKPDRGLEQQPMPRPDKSVSRHEEMRRRGEEKRRLLASFVPKGEGITIPNAEPESLFRIDVTQEESPAELRKPNKSKKRSEKMVHLFKDADLVKTTLDPSKAIDIHKHSEHKRKKMRAREKAKREKIRVKKLDKAETRQKRRGNHPRFNEVIDRPSESIKELGLQLAQKLGKESSALHAAYNSIGKNRNVDI